MSIYVTTHDADGKAIFSKKVAQERAPIAANLDRASLSLLWSNTPKPDLSSESDVDQYVKDRVTGAPPSPDLTTAYYIELEAGNESPWHRKLDLAIIVTMEGEVELELDSGEKRTMKAGDVLVQRATNHKIKNVTPGGGVAKSMVFSQPITTPVVIGGKTLDDI